MKKNFLTSLFMLPLLLVMSGCPTQTAPQALFLATPLSGPAPLEVRFFDLSLSGSAPIESWEWNFGEAGTSIEQNPVILFTEPGLYPVTLSIASAAGSDTRRIERLISVFEVEPVEGEGNVEGALEGEGLTEGEGGLEGEGQIEGEGVTEGEGQVEGEGATEGEGQVDGEGQAEGEGQLEGEGALEGEGEPGDVTPPAVTSTDPADAALNVPLASKVRVYFNEAMSPASVTQNSLVLNPEVAGVVTYGAGVIVFTPSAPLEFNTVYTATVSQEVSDVAGNALGTPYLFTFRTLPREVSLPLGFSVDDAVFVPDSPVVALMSKGDRAVSFYDSSSGLLLEQHTLSNEPRAMALGDGSLFVADVFGNVYEYVASSGVLERVFSVATQPFDMLVDSRGRLLVSELRLLDGRVNFDIYDLATTDLLATSKGDYERQTLRLTPDESEIWGFKTSGSPKALLRYSNPETGTPVRLSQYLPENAWAADRWFTFSPTGDYILTDLGDRINVLRTESSVTLASGPKLANRLYDALFDTTLSLIVTTEEDGLHVYDLATAQEIEFRPYEEPEVAFVGWSVERDALFVVYDEAGSGDGASVVRYPLEELLEP